MDATQRFVPPSDIFKFSILPVHERRNVTVLEHALFDVLISIFGCMQRNI